MNKLYSISRFVIMPLLIAATLGPSVHAEEPNEDENAALVRQLIQLYVERQGAQLELDEVEPEPEAFGPEHGIPAINWYYLESRVEL